VTPNTPPALFDQLRARRPRLGDAALIRELCEQLLAEAEAEPPVPVQRIASLRGIAEIREADQPFAGMLSPRGRNFAAFVRAADSYERQRFTICHETAHTLFAGYSTVQLRCGGPRTELEQRCDIAATELLLPYRFFIGDLADAGFGLDGTEELATLYEASIEATALRSVDLWPEPAMLIVLRERHKPAERGREDSCLPKLRLDYAHAAGSWPYMRAHKSVADDSPLGRAFAGELIHETVDDLGELSSGQTGPVEIHARRYGRDGRVLALVRRASTRGRSRQEVRA
jgi:IrrE N-terminal-like domain